MYSAGFQENLPWGLMYSGIRLDLKAVNRRKISCLEKWGLKFKSKRKTLGSSNQGINPFGPSPLQKCHTKFVSDSGLWIQLLHVFPFRCIFIDFINITKANYLNEKMSYLIADNLSQLAPNWMLWFNPSSALLTRSPVQDGGEGWQGKREEFHLCSGYRQRNRDNKSHVDKEKKN